MALDTKDKVIKDALKVFAEEYIMELGKNLKRLKKIATGDLIKSLDSRVIQTAMGTKFTVQVISEDYLKYVDAGRRPGAKMPPHKAISDWAKVKGIRQSAVFLIRRSISINGIKPTNVIQKSLTAITTGKAFNNLDVNVNNYIEKIVDEMIDNYNIELSSNNNITIS